MNREKAPARQSAGHTSHATNCSRAHCMRVLAVLQNAPVDTFDARKQLEIPTLPHYLISAKNIVLPGMCCCLNHNCPWR